MASRYFFADRGAKRRHSATSGEALQRGATEKEQGNDTRYLGNAELVQPYWKRLLSWLHEFHIESAPSEFNPHLYVSLIKGRYQLATKNAIYSYGDLYENFSLTFDRLKWDRYNIQDVLLLGLGLGSIPFMLENKYNLYLRYTAVEIDENVVYLANKYVLKGLESPLTLHISDAHHFIQQNQEKYHLICMDVFLDDEIPLKMLEKEFLRLLKSTLHENGLLLFNCLARTKRDVILTKRFLNVFLEIFPEGGYLDVKGNWMLVNLTESFGS